MDFNQFNGYLMSKDIVLAQISNGEITDVLNFELLPIYISKTKNIKKWVEKRAVDRHRTHSRLLKKVLRLTERDDVATALSVNAVTITDTYWIKPEDSDLCWEDVKFKENYFSELALRGDLSAFSQKPSRTPELTNIGSFEKCWKLENNQWWIYKVANQNELFSELFIYNLGKELGFYMAHYEEKDGYIRSLDFTNAGSVNFEPAFGFMGDNEAYVDNYKALGEYGSKVQDQYVEMILLDSFCLNADRHTFNYGVLRDVDTGKVLSLAPNFDNNIALIYNGYSRKGRSKDILGQELFKLESETRAISTYLSRNSLPIITPEMVDKCIDATGVLVDREYVHEFVKVGYEQTPLSLLSSENINSVSNTIPMEFGTGGFTME